MSIPAYSVQLQQVKQKFETVNKEDWTEVSSFYQEFAPLYLVAKKVNAVLNGLELLEMEERCLIIQKLAVPSNDEILKDKSSTLSWIREVHSLADEVDAIGNRFRSKTSPSLIPAFVDSLSKKNMPPKTNDNSGFGGMKKGFLL